MGSSKGPLSLDHERAILFFSFFREALHPLSPLAWSPLTHGEAKPSPEKVVNCVTRLCWCHHGGCARHYGSDSQKHRLRRKQVLYSGQLLRHGRTGTLSSPSDKICNVSTLSPMFPVLFGLLPLWRKIRSDAFPFSRLEHMNHKACFTSLYMIFDSFVWCAVVVVFFVQHSDILIYENEPVWLFFLIPSWMKSFLRVNSAPWWTSEWTAESVWIL